MCTRQIDRRTRGGGDCRGWGLDLTDFPKIWGTFMSKDSKRLGSVVNSARMRIRCHGSHGSCSLFGLNIGQYQSCVPLRSLFVSVVMLG